MYREYFSPVADISSLKAGLEDLKQQAISRSSRNREILSARMAKIRAEIETLRQNPIAVSARRSVYQDFNTASLIDIKG